MLESPTQCASRGNGQAGKRTSPGPRRTSHLSRNLRTPSPRWATMERLPLWARLILVQYQSVTWQCGCPVQPGHIMGMGNRFRAARLLRWRLWRRLHHTVGTDTIAQWFRTDAKTIRNALRRLAELEDAE